MYEKTCRRGVGRFSQVLGQDIAILSYRARCTSAGKESGEEKKKKNHPSCSGHVMKKARGERRLEEETMLAGKKMVLDSLSMRLPAGGNKKKKRSQGRAGKENALPRRKGNEYRRLTSWLLRKTAVAKHSTPREC